MNVVAGGSVPAAPPPQERLDARYGRTPGARRRTRRTGLVAAVLGVFAAVSWGVWTGVGGVGGDTTDLQTIGFTILSGTEVRVEWGVTGAAGTRLACAIEAQSEDRAVVGLVEVAVPPSSSPAERTATTVVRTVRPAVTGLLSSCRRA